MKKQVQELDSIMKWLWRAIEILAWTAFFAFAGAVLALRFWLLPDIERHRDEIVAAIAHTLGQPVSIGGIEAGWLGLRPRIGLSDVRLYDPEGRPALVLPRVDNVLSWRSLLEGRLQLHSLVIDGPRLQVRRDKAGALHIAGMRVADAGGEQRATDWLLAQEEVVIRDAEIEWRDDKRGAPPLALSSLSLRLRNAGDTHALGLAARPPAELASAFELRAELKGRSATDLAAWNGRIYAEFGYTDLAAWHAWVDYPIDLWQGRGALRLWAALRDGELTQATVDLALAQVAVFLGEDLAPIELESVRGRLQGSVRGDSYELAARALELAPAHGPLMPGTDLKLSWRPRGNGREAQGALGASLVELEAFAQLATALPLPEGARRLAADLAPRGQLIDARVEWQGSAAQPQRLAARARFAGVALRPHGVLPGFAGLSGTLEATEERGTLVLAARKAELDLPRVLPEPRVALDTLNGRLDWERRAHGGFALRISTLSFANAHLAGDASGVYFSEGSAPGTVDLSAQLSRADGRHLARYLPRAEIMGAATRDWLARAVLEGQASDVRLRLQGDLRNFPFIDPYAGQFTVSARVQKGVLDYAHGWPRIEDIDAELLFERDRMSIVGRSGSILGARLSETRVTIPRLARGAKVLVKGQAEGPTGEFLDYIARSPLRRMTGGATDDLSASGRGKLRLALELPLAELAASKVTGEYDIQANNVGVHPLLPPIREASGKLSFSESSFALHDVRGRFLGGPVTLSGGLRAGSPIEIVARGEADIAQTRALFEHPWQRHLAGTAPYSARVSARAGEPRIIVESSLVGVTSALPPPLAKPAAEPLPLRVELTPAEAGARDRLSITLGRIAAAEVLRRRQGAVMAVQRAGLWLSPSGAQAVRMPERAGMLVYGSLAALDLDRWMPLLGEGGSAGAAALELRIGALDVYGKRVHDLNLRAGADAAGWSASVSARELAGDLRYRHADGGRLSAQLSHFITPDASPGASVQSPGQSPGQSVGDPRRLPAVELVAERFNHRGKDYGRVELSAQRAGPDWRIDKVAMANPAATLKGKGMWRAGTPSRTVVEFDLESGDPGGFLGRVGYPNLVSGGRARMQAALAWNGDPATLDYPSLAGTLQLQAQDGRFLEVEPGIGKLISLMSLQALPRRLALDFRDVFSKGFQFERIAASAQVEGGVMAIRELRMRGSAARVEMSGSVDLAKETQQLNVRVVPSLGDSASTVLAFFNPLLVFPAALAQRILKDPLGHIFAFDYAVTGDWSDPKVEKVGVDARAAEPTFPE
jgi:uncharacterized protein (TIGR02099 family)